jgi:protein TonB
MFNNLVECAKTKKENKQWAYFLVTSTVWTLALTGSIIGGIFLYDAKLDEQLSVLTMLISPPPPPPPPPSTTNSVSQRTQPNQPTTVDVPTRVKPETIVEASELSNKPAATGLVKLPGSGEGGGVDGGLPGGVDGGQLDGVLEGVINSTGKAGDPPAPKPDLVVAEPVVEKVVPSLVRRSEGVLKGNTITQVRPEYPAIARTAGVAGEVKVDITIGEDGNVVLARVLSGPPMLQQAALVAAKQWKFNPTLLSGTPVKVQGILTFRFSL